MAKERKKLPESEVLLYWRGLSCSGVAVKSARSYYISIHPPVLGILPCIALLARNFQI